MVNTVVNLSGILYFGPLDALIWDTFEKAVPMRPFGLEPMPTRHSQYAQLGHKTNRL